MLGLTLPALTFALSIDRVLNGVCRPFFGWVSDQIGRENTMFIAFLIEGIGIYALLMFAHDPVSFVILSGLVFFAWGEIYSLFPATVHGPLRPEVRDRRITACSTPRRARPRCWCRSSNVLYDSDRQSWTRCSSLPPCSTSSLR